MEIRKADAIPCDAVDVGRADLTAKATDIGKAQIVGDDDEEVGARHDEMQRCRISDAEGALNI